MYTYIYIYVHIYIGTLLREKNYTLGLLISHSEFSQKSIETVYNSALPMALVHVYIYIYICIV